MCIASGTEDGAPNQAPIGKTKATATVECEICGMDWAVERIRHHIGAHLLTNSWGKIPAEKRPRYPCGMCGIRGAIQYQRFAGSVTGCPVSLTKHNQTLKAMHQCKHAEVPTYSLAPASNCTVGAPCTNIPLVCRRCNPKPMPVIIYKLIFNATTLVR